MLPLQVAGDEGELVKCGLQVLGDFGSDHVGGGQVRRVLQALVFQPEDVQVHLVALEKLLVRKTFEAVG